MKCFVLGFASLLFLVGHTATAVASADEPDSSMVLKGDEEGTVFRSLTVEGEDRVQIDFERPKIDIDLDTEQVSGLQWGSALEVLQRTTPEIVAPLLQISAWGRSPGLARPWLRQLDSGPVASFRPNLEGVERWRLTLADARGDTVKVFEGNRNPPEQIQWDGTGIAGARALPGLTYSYVMEASDKAGNRRNFIGEGFQIDAYRRASAGGRLIVIGGAEVRANETLPLETASWINQESPRAPVRITAQARDFAAAESLAHEFRDALAPHMLGDPARIQISTKAESDAPADGVILIETGLAAQTPANAAPKP